MIFKYKGIDVCYSDNGHGEAVVLLHGFLENSSMWKPFIPQFSENNRIVTIDLLGHGNTGCIGYLHAMEMMAECVNAVLNHLEINKAIFIGHSMGGYVALAITELFPNKINGVCLMNSTPVADTAEKQLFRDRAIAAVKLNKNIFIGMSVANLFAPENREHFSEEINTVKMEAQKMSLQGVIAALEGMKIRKDRSVLFGSLSAKKMIILGRKDPVLDYDSLMSLPKNNAIKIVEFPDGHMSYIENKKSLSYKIMQFIEN